MSICEEPIHICENLTKFTKLKKTIIDIIYCKETINICQNLTNLLTHIGHMSRCSTNLSPHIVIFKTSTKIDLLPIWDFSR